MPKYFYIIFVSLATMLMAHSANAAVIYILPADGNFSVNTDVTIDVKIDSESESVNAAQATVSWPSSIFEFASFIKDGSVFNFWVDEPKVSSDGKSLSFIGGAPKGISGSALQILKIRLRAKGSGAAQVSLTEAAVTAADGKGTNVLSNTRSATFSIGIGTTTRPQDPLTQEVPQPLPVVRPAVPAKGLPAIPVVSVPLYSDPEKWHNHLGETVALWDVPNDVSQMAVLLNHSPNSIPTMVETELFTGKKFGVLEDGIWYVHVRFKNNIGWGATTHYRIAIDTAPPITFEVTSSEGEATDNPAPVVKFESSDALSGLLEYQVRINDNKAIKIKANEFSGNFTLPLQSPGIHRVIVKAFDLAENSVEDSIDLEIIPIPSPNITFITKEIFSDTEASLTVKGTTLPGIDVLLRVQQLLGSKRGEVVAKSTALSNEKGNWEFTFGEPLRNGRYIVIAQNQDSRGALSLAVESPGVRVKSKPVIQIGFIQLGKGGSALALLMILVMSFGGGIWFYKKRQEKLGLRVEFAESEVSKIFKLITEDAEQLSKTYQTPTTADDEYMLKRLKENIKKMELYLKKGIEKIKK